MLEHSAVLPRISSADRLVPVRGNVGVVIGRWEEVPEVYVESLLGGCEILARGRVFGFVLGFVLFCFDARNI